jgi:hypothetical protein
MNPISRRGALASLAGAAVAARAQSGGEWIPLFDGKTLTGWKANENEKSWTVKDGCLAGAGPRSHLFYTGPVHNANFKNFELRAEVMTRDGTNSGIYFHTAYLPEGWPSRGFEVQVNNSHVGEGNYRERKKTGSLYGVRNTYLTLAKDGEWFEMRIAVRAPQVQIWVKDRLVVDFIEPDPPVRAVNDMERVLGSGTFALQCHDPRSPVMFRNIAVRPLAGDPAAAIERPHVDEIYRELLRMSAQNYPLVDYHVHLKSNLTLQDALRMSRQTGIGYGLAINVGLGFAVSSDAGARDFQAMLRGQPVFVALQGEGREWPTLLSKETIARFDYVFTDAMTFRDDNGKRMRLWINSDVGEIPDPERFVEMYVNRIAGVLEKEPIDIYASPTFLPEVIQAQYDKLWTPKRMQKVIDAAKKNDVAIEINNRYRVPGAAFIKQAKQSGVKFTFGTNNADNRIGRLEYGVEMVRECGLTWQDFFVPRPDGQKPVQVRG